MGDSSFSGENSNDKSKKGGSMSASTQSGPGEALSAISGRTAQVAIIGRPNVGKSTLFNIITDSRKSVVKNQPGVTRDIVIQRAHAWGKDFDVIDTGGMTEAADRMSQLIREQVIDILSTVDFLLVVVDGRAGLIPEDRDVIRLAQASKKPILIVVNKIDREHELDLKSAEFFEFGAEVVGVSCERRLQVDQILAWICERIADSDKTHERGVTIALVGKPNVGKSSLANKLLGYRRMLVSEIAGTTVDSVDTPLEYNGKQYTLVDTAGLRRSARRTEDVEIIAAFKTQNAIAKADVIALMVSLPDGITEQDAKILSLCLETGKSVVLVANKSDLPVPEQENPRLWFRAQVEDQIQFYPDIPIVFISALTGKGLKDFFAAIDETWEKLHRRIPTSQLNDFFMRVIRQAPAPVYGTVDVKFYYLTQTHQIPPSFIAFANHPEGVTPGYRRFLAKRLKAEFDLEGIPVRIFVMGRKISAHRSEATL